MTTPVENIHGSIVSTSNQILANPAAWKKRLDSSKNFVCTPDLQHWTFGKSVGDDGKYHEDGGAARRHLEELGFINIFTLQDEERKQEITEAFLNWAHEAEAFAKEEANIAARLAANDYKLFIHKNFVVKNAETSPVVQ